MISRIARPTRASRFLSVLLVASLFLGALAPTVEARRPVAQDGIGHKLAQKLFAGFEKVVRETVERANRAKDLSLEIESLFSDGADRVFLDVVGKARLSFKKAPSWLHKKMVDGKGYHLATNGSIAVDFMVRDVRAVEERVYEVDFELDVVLLLHPFLGEMARIGASTLGLLTLDLIAGRMIEFLENADTAHLGEALASGIHEAAGLVAKDTGEEVYEIAKGFDGVQEVLKKGISPMGVLYSIGIAIVKGVAGAGVKLAGLTLGGAVGATLFPAGGAAIGTIVATAAVVLVGRVVVKKITSSVPAKWRLWRIKRAYQTGNLQNKTHHEQKVLARIEMEAEREHYETLDLFVAALEVEKAREDGLDPFRDLIHGILQKLQFYVLQEGDWNASRKYYQLKAVLED